MSWQCSYCTFADNREESLACNVCFAERHHSRGWTCNKCTFDNGVEEIECRICCSSKILTNEASHEDTVISRDDRVTCPICRYEDSRDSLQMFHLESCGHVYCRNCLNRYIDVRVEQGETTLILCPFANVDISMGGCGNMQGLSQNELRGILGDQSYRQLDRRALEKTVAMDSSLHQCPSPDCPYVVSWGGPDDGVPCVDCPICCKTRCLVCGVSPYHTNQACDPVIHDCNNYDNIFCASSNIKRCKRCGVGIIKDFGCDKVMCRCGYRFCWECGSENAQCQCTQASHGFIDNVTGHAVFSNLRDATSPT